MSERLLRGQAREVATQLRNERRLESGRILVFVVGPDAEARTLAEALPPPAELVPATAPDALNRAREALAEGEGILLVHLQDRDAAPAFLRAIPDVTDWLSFIAVLETAPESDPAALQAERRAYLERVRDRYGVLDLTGLLPGFAQEWRIPLDQIYLPLVEEPRDERRHILVLGHPGTGKTTYIRHRAWELAVAGLEPASRVLPVVIPAAEYAAACARRLRPLREYIVEKVESMGSPHARQLVDHAGKELVLLMDAIDEVEPPHLDLVVRSLAEFVHDTPGQVVATCRAALANRLEKPLKDLRPCTPEKPNADQVERFVEAFVAAHHGSVGRDAADSTRSAAALKQALRAPDLAPLVSTPLTLTFMALLHVVDGSIPKRRIELYHRLGWLLIERWNIARSLAGALRALPYGEAVRVFAPLAWWMHEHHPGGMIAEDELIERLASQQVHRGEQEEKARESAVLFLDRLRRDMLLLIPDPEGRRWSFFHPTLAEYFAGLELARNRDLQARVIQERRLFDADLREPLLFALGELGLVRADDESLAHLVDAILEQSRRRGRYDARYPSLLTEILAEDVGLDLTRIRRVVARLLDFWFDVSFSSWARIQTDQDALRLVRGDLADRVREPLRLGLQQRIGSGLSPARVERLFPSRSSRARESLSYANRSVRLLAARHFFPLGSRLPEVVRDLALSPAPILRSYLRSAVQAARVVGWHQARALEIVLEDWEGMQLPPARIPWNARHSRRTEAGS